jgi:hypothetical protein
MAARCRREINPDSLEKIRTDWIEAGSQDSKRAPVGVIPPFCQKRKRPVNRFGPFSTRSGHSNLPLGRASGRNLCADSPNSIRTRQVRQPTAREVTRRGPVIKSSNRGAPREWRTEVPDSLSAAGFHRLAMSKTKVEAYPQSARSALLARTRENPPSPHTLPRRFPDASPNGLRRARRHR